MQKELDAFESVLENPKRPFLAILGRAKVADKIPLIRNLLDKADEIIIGGGILHLQESARGHKSARASSIEGAKIVGELMEKAKEKGVKIHLAVDFCLRDKFDANAQSKLVDDQQGIPKGWMGLDVGPRAESFCRRDRSAKTIIWNRPPGVFEFDRLPKPRKEMAEPSPPATAGGAVSVVGGGDTATAAKKFKVVDKVSHVSTGGRLLELLEGKTLPE